MEDKVDQLLLEIMLKKFLHNQLFKLTQLLQPDLNQLPKTCNMILWDRWENLLFLKTKKKTLILKTHLMVDKIDKPPLEIMPNRNQSNKLIQVHLLD